MIPSSIARFFSTETESLLYGNLQFEGCILRLDGCILKAMRFFALALFFGVITLGPPVFCQNAPAIQTETTYAKAYGETKNPVAVDPGKDLPRYPAVEPKDAISTWQVKKGFKLQLAAHEPQVRDPIAICFDERGRMFVCEMNDYSEMRDVTPHLGRVSMLEDKDGDGYYETSQIFADDLPWPTGLIWANGGLYVGATPDIWRFEDKDSDGKAEVREKVFTGFGTGLKILNVQGLMNSFQWGQDNRVHVLAGGGNRGIITSPKNPTAKGIELGGKDFWFDPLTHEFGIEGGGAQYGMSFDNYGRKFGCSNSDHLQYWVYPDHYANRNPYYQMPPSKQSIAADGGAAEVFRISPDEPWRIIRTRWRIAGVVKGAVEGGGRVSGYFTGATGTTIYRGDAYGPDFVNNSFTGDAGGQLVHRKIIKPSADGISLVGERPADEHGFEFAASKDTWVRVVNFANAPDGCLHICDMYREVIEHPWSIPDEIKKHIDLNSGNDRGRIYRIVPESGAKRIGQKVDLAAASTEELVKMLGHENGWHRDTAQRLLHERKDKSAVPFLEQALTGDSALAKLHALNALESLGALRVPLIMPLIGDPDGKVRERGIALLEKTLPSGGLLAASYRDLESRLEDPDARVRFQALMTLGGLPPGVESSSSRHQQMAKMLASYPGNRWIEAAVLSADPDAARQILASLLTTISPGGSTSSIAALVKTVASHSTEEARQGLISQVVGQFPKPEVVTALSDGLRRAGTTLQNADAKGELANLFAHSIKVANDQKADLNDRIEAIQLLSVANSKDALAALATCLGQNQPDSIQAISVRVLSQNSSEPVTSALIENWPNYGPKAKEAAMGALLSRDDRALALLEAKVVKPQEYSASQVQALIKHKSPQVATMAKTVLASVIPPSREEVAAKFKPAVVTKGDLTKGQVHFMARCMACHKAGANGIAVGPDLITVKTKGREALLEAILMPHKEVASQFIAYNVNTKAGQSLAGIITNDTASSMTIRMMGGAEMALQRADIKGSSSTGQSLMPEGLETGMSVADMADLISFIESL